VSGGNVSTVSLGRRADQSCPARLPRSGVHESLSSPPSLSLPGGGPRRGARSGFDPVPWPASPASTTVPALVALTGALPELVTATVAWPVAAPPGSMSRLYVPVTGNVTLVNVTVVD